DDVGMETDVAANDVVEDDVARFGNAEADGGPLAGGKPLRRLVARQPAARAGVARRPAGGDRLLPLRFELRGGAETVVGRVGADQLFRVRLIQVQPLRLPVWAA